MKITKDKLMSKVTLGTAKYWFFNDTPTDWFGAGNTLYHFDSTLELINFIAAAADTL